MKHNIRLRALLLALIITASLAAPGLAALDGVHWTWGSIKSSAEVTVAPGALYRTLDISSPIGPQKIHSIEFDPKNPMLALRAGMSGGTVNGTQTVPAMAADFNKKGQGQVVAGINGDYFNFGQGVPFGIFMDEGELLSSPPQYSAAFGIKNDGTAFVVSHGTIMNKILHIGDQKTHLTGINNRHQDENSIILYNDKFASSTKAKAESVEVVCDVVSGALRHGENIVLRVVSKTGGVGDTKIPAGKMVLSAVGSYKPTLSALTVGQEVTVELSFNDFWSDVKFAIAGNYVLLKDGAVQNVSGSERAPRTVIGVKPDGKVVFYTIDGRLSGYSVGATYKQAGTIMRDLGCSSALNLDGGGSTTFVLRNLGAMDAKMINRSADGGARAVANGALLVNTAPVSAPSRLLLSPSGQKVLVGGRYSFSVTGAMDANLLSYAVPSGLTWWMESATGTLSETGVYQPTAAGAAIIHAGSGSATGTATVEAVDSIIAIGGATSLTIKANAKQKISVSLARGSDAVQFTNDLLTWSVDGDIGTFTAPGEFTANRAAATGTITVSYGGVSKKIAVTIDGPEPEVFEKFKDMGTHRWAKEAVYRLFDAGVIRGVSDSAFAPGKTVKRADFMLMLVRMMGIPVDTNPADQFSDVPQGAYYYNELATAKRLGIARGISDTQFAPERNITREEMFTLTWRVLKQYGYLTAESPLSALAQFSDQADISPFAQQAIATLCGNGLVEGDNRKRANPKGNALRAESAVFLDRVLTLMKR